jgi:hypothetical protein
MDGNLELMNGPLLFPVQTPEIVNALRTHISLVNYLARPVALLPQPDRRYADNRAIWNAILNERLRASITVVLEDFYLFEWFPRSPGLFYTPDAEQSRRYAHEFEIPYPGSPQSRGAGAAGRPESQANMPDFMHIFNPFGKLEMLKGGIGSIRLQDKVIEGEHLWFMTASSTCTAHEGFPIALPDYYYQRIIDQIINNGIASCTITGTLRFVPDMLHTLYEDYTRVPQLYLKVDELQPSTRKPGEDEIPRVSVAVSFRSKEFGASNIFYSYVTFFPSQPGSLASRVDWLENIYVKSMYHGEVITDFDEHSHRFEGAVFSLKKVFEGKPTMDEAQAWVRSIHIHGDANFVLTGIAQVNAERDVHMNQDNSVHISGNIINSNVNIGSTLSNVNQTITAANDMDETTKQQLKELVENLSVELKKTPENKAEEAQAVADLTKTLVEEGTKPTPNKTTIQITAEGLKTAAQNIANVMPVVLTIATGIVKTIFQLRGIPLP